MVGNENNVLVVDDEKMICELLNAELSEKGYLCTTVNDAQSALSQLNRTRFDIVLLDIKLPDMSGIDVLKKIQPILPNTIIFMITAISDVSTTVEAMKLGACDYVVKPFDIDRLENSMDSILKARKNQREHYIMDAIAKGVEAIFDPTRAYSNLVTQKVTDIACHLEVPQNNIQSWREARKIRDSKIKSIAQFKPNKLKQLR